MAKMTRLVSAMHGDAGLGKKHRIGHRRIVILIAVVVDFHAERLKRPTGCVVAGTPGRYRPLVQLLAVKRDCHTLRRLIDLDQEAVSYTHLRAHETDSY